MKKISKKWRNLPIKTKLEIPKKYFGIDEKTLQNIRKIKDPKKRLIESAKIQYELFGEMHTFLIAWIAGYASDSVVRQVFGSTNNLREIFIEPPKFDARINPSWSDLKRKIKIPEKMTGDLAEEIGIHIGDGSLSIYTGKDGFKSYHYSVNGDLIDEYIYHKDHIAKIMKRLFNIETRFVERNNKNSIESRYRSKALVQFKSNVLGLSLGNKKNIAIPKEILKDNEFMKRCIVGVLDTDFSITSSLAISGKINNLLVAKEMNKFFEKNKIDHVFRLYPAYARFYINKESATKIVNEWKLSNPKHISKYSVYAEFGKFIPYSTTPERIALLANKLDVGLLEKECKKRSFNKKK